MVSQAAETSEIKRLGSFVYVWRISCLYELAQKCVVSPLSCLSWTHPDSGISDAFVGFYLITILY